MDPYSTGTSNRNVVNLMQVQRADAVCQELRNEFGRYEEAFEKWREHRKKTLDVLSRLKKKLDDVHFGSNVAQCISNVVGIAGGITGIASAGVSFSGQNEQVARNLDISSSTLSLAGTVASVSAIAIEKVISQKILNEIKTIVEKDMELLVPILRWLKYSRQLDSVLRHLFECSVWSKDFECIMVLCGSVMGLLNARENSTNQIRDLVIAHSKQFQNMTELTTHSVEKCILLLENVCHNSQLMESMKSIYKSYKESPFLFEFSKLGLKVYLEIRQQQNLDALQSVKSSLERQNMRRNTAVTRIIFEAIKIAADTVSLISAATKIHEKARSEYSDMLEKLLFLLSNELGEVSAVHLRIIDLYVHNDMQ